MLKKIIILTLMFASLLSAANVDLERPVFTTNEEIKVTFSEMTAKNQDWIGIYPKESNNDFANCISWQWTNDVEAGELIFKDIPAGDYEVRAFYNNSGKLEAKLQFTVTQAVEQHPSILTNKPSYDANEAIVVSFDKMLGKNQDWIGIYPKNSDNNFANCISWKWTNDVEKGELTFDNIPDGQYEARAFYNNSAKLEAKTAFEVTGEILPISLTTNKDVYQDKENIQVTFSHMTGKNQDWIGIYPKESNNNFVNCLVWKWTNDVANGTLTFAKNLPGGEYEVRAFYNNSAKVEATKAFSIIDNTPNKILYDDAEDGLDPRWQRISGRFNPRIIKGGAKGSQHAIQVRADQTDGENKAFYMFNFQNPATKLRYLELDVRAGVSSHVGYFGLIIETTEGTRWMTWASWMNHNRNGINDMSGNAIPLAPMKKVYGTLTMLMYPGPTDYFLIPLRNGQKFEHYKINIEKQLQRLEPNNKLIRIKEFITTGVDLDNLTLYAK